jgi:hypothetical protein
MGALPRNAPVRDYGRYGYQTINGFVRSTPGFGFDGQPVNGMPLQTIWMYGSWQALESGNYYAALRHMSPTSAMVLLFYKAEPDGDFETVPGAAQRAYRGGVFNQVGDRHGLWDVMSTPDNQFFTLNVGPDGYTYYKERGMIDVEGHQRGDLMQSVVVDARSPMTYTSRCVASSGTVMGEKVEGFFFTDHHHLQAGTDWLVSDFFHGVQGIWVVFSTEYEDGSWDIGNLFWGYGGFGSGMVQSSNGDRVATTTLRAEVDQDQDSYTHEARFYIGSDEDEVWKFNCRHPEGHPRMPLMKIAGSPRWNEGVVTRVGDNRKWVKSEAWMEIYPSTIENLARGTAPIM